MIPIRRNLAVQITAGGTDPLKLRLQQSTLTIGTAGSIALIPQGGTAPYAVSLLNGALPTVCSFTGSITGNVLTVTAVANGTLAVGQVVAGAGVTYGAKITSLGTGTGGTGTYNLSSTPNVGSEAMTTSPALSTAGAAAFATGTLPSVAGTFTFTAQVQDSTSPTPQVYVANFTVRVAHVLVGVNVTPPDWEFGDAGTYNYQFAVSGATGTVSYSKSGTLPNGITFSSTGALSGISTDPWSTPTTLFNMVVTAYDSGTGDSVDIPSAFTFYRHIKGTGLPPQFDVDAGVFFLFNASGYANYGVVPYAFTPTTIPSWLSWDSVALTVSGTPSDSDVGDGQNIFIDIKDANGFTASIGAIVNVKPRRNPRIQPQKTATNIGPAGPSIINFEFPSSGTPDVTNDGTTMTVTIPTVAGATGSPGHGSTTTTAAPTASGGNWIFTLADTTAFSAIGLPIYCIDVANASNWIRGHVISFSSTTLTIVPDATSGSISSITNGSTFTFSGVAGTTGPAGGGGGGGSVTIYFP